MGCMQLRFDSGYSDKYQNKIYMKIWIDDQINDPETPRRHTPDGYVGVTNFDQFKETLETAIAKGEPIEVIDFDNDLGTGEKEGHEILSWLADNYPEIILGDTKIEIHSANPIEREAMKKQLESYERNREIMLSAKDRESPWKEAEK